MSHGTEGYTIVWLDSHINDDDDCKDAVSKLKDIVDDVQVFLDADAWRNYIFSVQGRRIVLIISGVYGLELTPLVHHLDIN